MLHCIDSKVFLENFQHFNHYVQPDIITHQVAIKLCAIKINYMYAIYQIKSKNFQTLTQLETVKLHYLYHSSLPAGATYLQTRARKTSTMTILSLVRLCILYMHTL